MTLKWWTHLWLKEGYATWIEFLCVDHLFPQWDIWTQFLTDTLNPAKSLDSLSSSHPIEVSLNSKIDCSNLPLGTSINFLIKVEVENPAQVDEIFIHTDQYLHGQYWEKVSKHPKVTVVYRESPLEIFLKGFLKSSFRSLASLISLTMTRVSSWSCIPAP